MQAPGWWYQCHLLGPPFHSHAQYRCPQSTALPAYPTWHYPLSHQKGLGSKTPKHHSCKWKVTPEFMCPHHVFYICFWKDLSFWCVYISVGCYLISYNNLWFWFFEKFGNPRTSSSSILKFFRIREPLVPVFQNQRTSGFSFMTIFIIKDPPVQCFEKESNNWCFTWNNRQRTSSFIEGYWPVHRLFKTCGHISQSFLIFLRPMVIYWNQLLQKTKP